MSIKAKVIADFVFSVAAILNFNLDYEKNISSLSNGFIWCFHHENVGFASKEISTIFDFGGGHFELANKQLLNEQSVINQIYDQCVLTYQNQQYNIVSMPTPKLTSCSCCQAII